MNQGLWGLTGAHRKGKCGGDLPSQFCPQETRSLPTLRCMYVIMQLRKFRVGHHLSLSKVSMSWRWLETRHTLARAAGVPDPVAALGAHGSRSSSAGCRLAVGVGLIWEGSTGSACLGTHGGIKLWLRVWGLGLWLRIQHHLAVLDGGPRAGDPTLGWSELQTGVTRGLLCPPGKASRGWVLLF